MPETRITSEGLNFALKLWEYNFEILEKIAFFEIFEAGSSLKLAMFDAKYSWLWAVKVDKIFTIHVFDVKYHYFGFLTIFYGIT